MPITPTSFKAALHVHFNEEIVQKICQFIRTDGVSDTCAGQLAGATAQALHQWKKRHRGFAEALQAARAEYRRARLEEIRNLRSRDGGPDWRAQAWLTENAGAEPADVAEPEDENKETELSPLLVIPPEQLVMLQKRRAAALEKMKPQP